MMVLKFMLEAVTGIPLYYRAHKFTFFLTMISCNKSCSF